MGRQAPHTSSRLVVEDEPNLCKAVHRTLFKSACDAIEAEDGEKEIARPTRYV